jgi:hypothetical protein
MDFVAGSHVDDPSVTGRAVWLVQILGKRPFSCECAVTSSRSGGTTANYMLIVVSVSTRRIISGASLYAERQAIPPMGDEVQLHS